jgi:RNA polymerase sigma-70 factor (ECF subfamily)
MDWTEKFDSKTDEELVVLSLQDSRNYYGLMRRYEDRLSAYIHHLTYLGNDDIADVIQETFIKAYTHLNDFDNSLKFSSWIYRIAHNEAINYLKKNTRQVKLEIDGKDEEFWDWLVADTNIEKEAIRDSHKECIKEIIANLSPEYKEVLGLRFMEDKDYQEISDILKKPMGTVATLLSRAKKQFKEAYEKNKKCQ